MYSVDFWTASLERAIRAAAWSLLGLWGTASLGIMNVDWQGCLSVAAMAFIYSIVASIAGDRLAPGTGPSLTGSEVLTSDLHETPADVYVGKHEGGSK